ncbi:HTH-type transcriptional regulator PuuR [Pantoea anthophila]|uniref:HTH-type transcriptional regulator PuuR n=1 Tax=Pantoea anthophila TaxID=470931 RepID=UPI00301C0D7F
MSDATLAPGRRLAEIRQTLGLSQRRVAELAGLTHSAISTIEQDKVSPAVSTLQKLLKVYGLSLSEFFSDPRPDAEPKIIVRPGELLEIGSQGVSLKLIDNGKTQRSLGMLLETYQPGASTGEKLRHPGEETGTLLEGEIILMINGQRFHLSAGESYVIDTGLPHSFTNSADIPCRIVSAHTPANF